MDSKNEERWSLDAIEDSPSLVVISESKAKHKKKKKLEVTTDSSSLVAIAEPKSKHKKRKKLDVTTDSTSILKISDMKSKHDSRQPLEVTADSSSLEDVFERKSETPLEKDCNAKRYIGSLLHGKWFQLAVISLASIDGLLLMVVLLIEIERIQTKDPVKAEMLLNAKFGLECVSLTILSVFMAEILLKLWIFHLRLFFTSVIESIDAVICVISFAFDIYVIALHKHEDHINISSSTTPEAVSTELPATRSTPPFSEAAGLLVLFRLWRVVRLINAIIVSTSVTHEAKIHEMKSEQEDLKARIKLLEDFIVSNDLTPPTELESS